MQIIFNSAVLGQAATEAGDTTRSGQLNYSSMGRRTGLDGSVISRVHRRVNPPDIKTLLALAKAYGLTVERLLCDDSLSPAA